MEAANVKPVRLSCVQVDRFPVETHNGGAVMLVRRCRSLLVLGLVVAMATAAWAECVSGDLTPEEQACCASMGHNCGAAGVEMACCPTEPQASDRVQVTSVKPEVLAPALLRGPVTFLPEPHVRIQPVAAASFDREALKLPERPTYLVLSVFLI
jgi:hypothetical protein